ncbi:exported protein of unknown function [Magnetospira sp. QH-2]|nr:exported protein of unknown function [Magnetospira sp. QH-2]
MLIIAVVMLAAGPLAPAWAYSAEDAHRIYLEAVALSELGRYEDAHALIKPVAEDGHAEAQHLMGYMYRYGEGVPQNHGIARKWYEKSAEQGLVKSHYSLGLQYFHGMGGDVDFNKAESYFMHSAKEGYADSFLPLGLILQNNGNIEYRYWLHKSADSGRRSAYFYLAVFGDREEIYNLDLSETFCFTLQLILPTFIEPDCED